MSHVALYLQLFTQLLAARIEEGGTLSQEDESRYAQALEDVWYKLTPEEQAEVEREVERSKTPPRALADLGMVDVLVQSGQGPRRPV